MHMADALLSPAVGGIMTAVSAVSIGYAVKKIAGDKLDEKKIPMMGVMGAFVFAAQMVNFAIPGTGSSGHIAGGVLLAALLGPYPAFLTMASVLLIQCLFFADGGLLAYGCNLFNMGACVCLLAYPLIFRPIVKRRMTPRNIVLASVASAVIGMQAGALCVVAQTTASGVAQLPFGAFAALMQPIHLVIGIVEGLITAAVLCAVRNMRPELLDGGRGQDKAGPVSVKKVVVFFLVLTVLAGGVLSLLASSLPDGLEWSVQGVAGAEIENDGTVHNAAAGIIGSTAVMPDYAFDGDENSSPLGTAAAGMIGSAVTVALAGGVGLMIHAARKRKADRPES